ncbi:hypothetical protein [Nitrosomonas communis]|uniref:hypothetical protein n=1 Tax=Nitrosomonas communis TaxID=44574 RepID=UPI0026EF44F4|nr:hypothetical protein [Nitrosomonas communis]MCO6427224.1 hypothetical protein [Nitrosomonas communis]
MSKINNIDSVVLIFCIQDNSVLEFKRYYPHEEAERILLRLKYIENEKKEKGFADDGLRILSNEKRRNPRSAD